MIDTQTLPDNVLTTAAEEGRELGPPQLAVADAVRDRVLRHRADGDRLAAATTWPASAPRRCGSARGRAT